MLLIIKGHKNIGYKLSDDSLKRCQKAIEIIKKNNIKKVIISGGIFNSEQIIPVSESMRSYIINHFENELSIVIENTSRTTIQNIENIIQKFSLKPNKEQIIFTTSWYHIIRCQLIWKFRGFKVKTVSAKAKFSLQKIFVEIVGIGIVFLYFWGIKFPEMYFRKKYRTV